jgi:hypothetical protein
MIKKDKKKISKTSIRKKYVVGFYDAFDGWHKPAFGEYATLERAKTECNKKMKKLDEHNKRMGEYYAVFNEYGKQVYRGY